MERLRRAKKAGYGEVRIDQLGDARVKERPAHRKPEEQDQAAVEFGIGHGFPLRFGSGDAMPNRAHRCERLLIQSPNGRFAMNQTAGT
jgi:hypothetical protein